MEGAKDKVARLGGLDRGAEGFLIADLTDQDHIGIFPQGRPQSILKKESMGTHFPLTDQGFAALVHKLYRILDGENMALHGAVDVIDHRRQRGALARSGWTGDQDHSLGPLRKLLEHRRQGQIVHRGDLLGNQAQHHRRPLHGLEKVDANPHEIEGMGSVEFLLVLEGVVAGRFEDFSQPVAEDHRIGDGPAGAHDVAAAAVTGLLPNAKVHIGKVVV